MISTRARLVAEHDLILQFLDNVSKAVNGEREGVNLGKKFWIDVVEFIREFADGFHHAKEEDLLFPVYCERGLRADFGPVAMMLRDHRMFRTCTERMVSVLETSDRVTPKFLADAAEYVNELRLHIAKENEILFPMGENLLSSDDENQLQIRFNEIEDQLGGDDTVKHFQQLVHSLATRLEKGEVVYPPEFIEVEE